MHFLGIKSWHFDLNFNNVFEDTVDNIDNGTGKGLGPYMRQAITRTSDDPFSWRLYVQL